MHEALLQVAGDEGRAFRATFLKGLECIHAELTLHLLGTMALDAMGFENRANDLSVVIAFLTGGDDARSLFLLGRGFRIRLEGEAFAVLEFATDMGREAHHADGHDLTNEAK